MEGPGGGRIPFPKGSEIPLAGRSFYGGPRGDSESPPLGPSKPPVTPLKRPLWGLAAPGAGPPPQRSAKGWRNLPAKRGKTEKETLIQRHCASVRALSFILPCPARQIPVSKSGANVTPKPLEGVGVAWRGLGGGITETSPWPLHKNPPRQGKPSLILKKQNPYHPCLLLPLFWI